MKKRPNDSLLTSAPTPEQMKAARINAGLTQAQASRMIFGTGNYHTFQNYELGTRQASVGTYILLMLMTEQATVKEAQAVVEGRM